MAHRAAFGIVLAALLVTTGCVGLSSPGATPTATPTETVGNLEPIPANESSITTNQNHLKSEISRGDTLDDYANTANITFDDNQVIISGKIPRSGCGLGPFASATNNHLTNTLNITISTQETCTPGTSINTSGSVAYQTVMTFNNNSHIPEEVIVMHTPADEESKQVASAS